MAEYIEREAVLQILTYYPIRNPDPMDIIPAILGTARKAVKNIPAADVVEVVRCGHCASYNDGKCDNPLGLPNPYSDSFCPFGKRRETVSLEIKGLSVPENCFRCFASSWYNFGGPDAGFRCNALPRSSKIVSNCEGRAKRRDDCPIVVKDGDNDG